MKIRAKFKGIGGYKMKWIIWTAIAIPAVLHWGYFGLMVMGVILALMLENEPSRNKEDCKPPQ